MEDRGAPIEAATSASHPKGATSSYGEDSSDATKAGNNPREAQKTSSNNHDSKSGLQKSTYSVEDALKEIDLLTQNGKLSMEHITVTRSILKEHSSLKEKVDKLKSLLGRSAKAQREAKIDLEATQKRLSQSLREIERLNQKLDKLQSRPTHLDLLMDFETNFDKALLSVGQTGGEDTSPPTVIAAEKDDSPLDSMLMQELGEAKARIEKLEALNSAMMARSTQLETSTRTLEKERDDARNANDRLQMELRMAKMEAENATRIMHDKQASLDEMQMEIDLITRASAKANSRAAKGEEMANSLKSDRQKVQELEAQVQALREWAQASAEAKRLIQERCSQLESKLKQSQGRSEAGDDSSETVLFEKNGSMVIGAGDTSHEIVGLGNYGSQVDSRFVILRWKFDSSPPDLTIDFNIMKGKCETAAQQSKADYLIKDRVITGGAGGESEGAFSVDGACTMLWSNVKSWIRPRTVKYSVSVVSLK